jgi:lipase
MPVRLHTRSWGPQSGPALVCVHGIGQHGGIFAGLGQRLADAGFRVVAVDLRGHGESDREPPWNIGTHVADLLETAADLKIERLTWVGHSFGGLLIANLAVTAPARAERLVLLDPGLEIAPAHSLKSAEMDRLDWSFATPDGAVNALLSSDTVVAAPREVLASFVAEEVVRGSDGRYRFRHSPAAAVTAWSESVLPAPPVAELPTLLVRPVTSPVLNPSQDSRYRAALGSRLSMAAVPHGHNLLWESPAETIAAIEAFLAKTADG